MILSFHSQVFRIHDWYWNEWCSFSYQLYSHYFIRNYLSIEPSMFLKISALKVSWNLLDCITSNFKILNALLGQKDHEGLFNECVVSPLKVITLLHCITINEAETLSWLDNFKTKIHFLFISSFSFFLIYQFLKLIQVPSFKFLTFVVDLRS